MMSTTRQASWSSEHVVPVTDEPGVSGILRASVYRQGADNAEATLRHVTRFVRGPDYTGMENNDLRGFLDGRFRWGWNQVSQMHVRIGRENWSADRPKYGECEIFRVLQRWDAIALPERSRIHDLRLTLTVEAGNESLLRLLLYAVQEDWKPGAGGVDGNNSSPPRPGEVWWNDAEFGVRPWGLPGVGFASPDHQDADTGMSPLAETVYHPGDERIEFTSSDLCRYAEDRITAGLPLLFLLKVSDHQEDIPGTILATYSAHYGDSRDLSRRPRLRVEWDSSDEVESAETAIRLEYGRAVKYHPVEPAAGDICAITLDPEPGSIIPALHVRSQGQDSPEGWRRVCGPFRWDGGHLELRMTAVSEPVLLGGTFVATIRDTWIRTGSPEEQRVHWTFRSPTGIEHGVAADYSGDFTWEVQFEPDELGPWTYHWRHAFTRTPYGSPDGSFGVVAADSSGVLRCLDDLERRLQVLRASDTATLDDLHRARIMFSRLVRAAMSFQEPDTFRGDPGRDLMRELDHVRSVLYGGEIPEQIPMVAHPPVQSPESNWDRLRRRVRRRLSRRISRLRRG